MTRATWGAVWMAAWTLAACDSSTGANAASPFDAATDARSHVDSTVAADATPDAANDARSPMDSAADTAHDAQERDAVPLGDAGVPRSCTPAGPGRTDCDGGVSGSCCTSPYVDGGAFYRTYDGGPTEDDPATVSGVRIDEYLVTVGRFRRFIDALYPTVKAANSDAGPAWVPPPGSGKHTHLNGGQGLVAVGGTGGTGFETGWVESDDTNIRWTDAELAACGPYSTWTDVAGGQEHLPITCANWYVAYAFCIWDGGFLPSEAEWEFAAAGGAEQRVYPWGSMSPGTDNQYAIFGYFADGGTEGAGGCYFPAPGGVCSSISNVAPVGTASLGAGRWGQLDMAGELFEWVLDESAPAYVDPCVDCAYLPPTEGTLRMVRASGFADPVASPWAGFGQFAVSDEGDGYDRFGFRCARAP